MVWQRGIHGLTAVLALSVATATAAQSYPDPGPPPTEREFYEAAGRAAHEVFDARIAGIDWREPRRGAVEGNSGYIACGDVRLRDHAEPVTVMVVWNRGDVGLVFVTWRYDGRDPWSDVWDMPAWLVTPLRETPGLCSAWTGESVVAGQQEGEPFAWSPPAPFPAGWREVRRETRRLDDADEFARVSECFRLRTRPGRRYRVTVEAPVDTSLSILTDRRCSGKESVIRWNNDASTTDRNPQVEFDGAGVVYVYVSAGLGSSAPPYVLVVEEADGQPGR